MAAGTYAVRGRIRAPSYNDGSFWVSTDGGDFVKWNDLYPVYSWSWRRVYDADGWNDPVISYPLEAGTHTLVIANREDGTRLDKLYITADGDVPTGLAQLPSGGKRADIPAICIGADTVDWIAVVLACCAVVLVCCALVDIIAGSAVDSPTRSTAAYRRLPSLIARRMFIAPTAWRMLVRIRARVSFRGDCLGIQRTIARGNSITAWNRYRH